MSKNPSDYRKFFSMEGVTPLQCNFLMKRSPLRMADLLAVNHKQSFHIFLDTVKEERCAAEGRSLFFDTARFEQYLSDFRSYIDEARRSFVPKYRQIFTPLSKEEFVQATDFMGTLWYLYGFTEFPIVDGAFSEAQRTNNKEVLKRLEDFAQFKFIGRDVLNVYWSTDGLMHTILSHVSKRFLSADDAKFLFLDELVSLFDGWRPPSGLVVFRREYYGACVQDDFLKVFEYTEARNLYHSFTHIAQNTEIHGIVVRPGKVSGRVIIAPLLSDRGAIAALDKQMQPGDILIAETTGPEIMMLCRKAAAIVADQGGMLSHAAVVSRELGIPCIIQTGNATRQLKNGDMVEVDAEKGIVTILTEHNSAT